MQFAQNVARVLKEQGMSQRALARATGINRTTVGRILDEQRRTSHYDPKLSTVQKMASALSIDISTIVDYPITTK